MVVLLVLVVLSAQFILAVVAAVVLGFLDVLWSSVGQHEPPSVPDWPLGVLDLPLLELE